MDIQQFIPKKSTAVLPDSELASFLWDRKSQNFSPRTIKFYQEKLYPFRDWCIKEFDEFKSFQQITPFEIRKFLEYLNETNHTPGGILAYFRAIKTFLLWFEAEYEPENWQNPIRKIKTPRVPVAPIIGVSYEQVQMLIADCDETTPIGLRDKAIFCILAECGVRSSELIRLNVSDVDTSDNSLLIRESKSKRPRSVFYGQTTRRVLRKHIKVNCDNPNGALFTSTRETRVKLSGLRQILRRHCIRVGIPEQSPHDFRRFFALQSLNKGVDLVTLSRLMGHNGLQVLSRYLAQTKGDLGNSYKSILD